MKNKIKMLIVGAALATTASFAATTTDTLGAGELLLGFYSSTGSNGATNVNMMVNLGSFQNFDKNDGATTTFSSALVSDLAATFGANWNTRSDISWAVTGAVEVTPIAGLPRNTIFATSPRATVSSNPTPIASNTDAALATPRTQVASIKGYYNSLTTTANSTVTVVGDAANAGSMSARQNTAPTVQFGPTNNNLTTNTSISDFYGLVSTNGTAPSGVAIDSTGVSYIQGTNYLGYFTLSSTGLTYTASGTSAIPEPSSFAVIGGLAALGYVASRRRNTKA